jgi:hypothetical protein
MNAGDVGRIAMSSNLGESLTRAVGIARAQGHTEVTLEHMLLALAEDPDAGLVLAASNIELSRLVADVSGYLRGLEEHGSSGSEDEPAVSSSLRRILEAAAAAAKGGRRREINGAIVLAAIVGDGKSPAAHILRSQGLTFEDAISAIQQGAGAPVPVQPDSGDANTDDILASARERVQTRAAPGLSERIGSASKEGTQPKTELDSGEEPQPAEDVGAIAATEEVPPTIAHPEVQTKFDGDQAEVAAVPDDESAEVSEPTPKAPPPGVPSSAASPPPIPVPGSQAEPPPRPRTPPPVSAGAPSLQSGPAEPAAVTAPSPAAERPSPPPIAPWPEARDPHDAAPRQPIPLGPNSESSSRARSGQQSSPSLRTEIGQLAENIPRSMRVAVPVLAEVRIARGEVKALAEGLQGGGAAYRHEVTVTQAMSVRLRAPDGGFFIETASPETQWIEKALLLSSDEFASWRWNVTPREKGKKRLQLVISARTVGADGLAAETALPDQVITVRVRTNYAKSMSRWAGWAIAALVGGLLARFGEGAYDAGLQAFAKVMAN